MEVFAGYGEYADFEIGRLIQAIEDLGMGLSLVDYDELDVAEIEAWTASLSESIRMLNRLNKRLKEKAQ